MATVAAQRGVSGLDAMLDLSLEDGLTTRFGVVIMNDDPDQVADLLRLEGAVLGLADSGADPDQLCDAVMPTDLLGGWVRERGALSLSQAVHKLTGEPAAPMVSPIGAQSGPAASVTWWSSIPTRSAQVRCAGYGICRPKASDSSPTSRRGSGTSSSTAWRFAATGPWSRPIVAPAGS